MEELTIKESFNEMGKLLFNCSFRVYKSNNSSKDFNYNLLNNLLKEIISVRRKLDKEVLDL